MTDQEYKQYLMESCSEEETRLYEDIYNEGIGNAIKSVGQAIFNRSNGNFIQRVANNYQANQINSQANKANKANQKANNAFTNITNAKKNIPSLDDNLKASLQQVSIDISNIVKGGGAQKAANKVNQQKITDEKNAKEKKRNDEYFNSLSKGGPVAGAGNNTSIPAELTSKKDQISYTSIDQEFNGDPKNKIAAAKELSKGKKDIMQIGKEYNLKKKESRVASMIGHFFEELEEGQLKNFLSSKGIATQDTQVIFNFLNSLYTKNIDELIKFLTELSSSVGPKQKKNIENAISISNNIKTEKENEEKRNNFLGNNGQAEKTDQPANTEKSTIDNNEKNSNTNEEKQGQTQNETSNVLEEHPQSFIKKAKSMADYFENLEGDGKWTGDHKKNVDAIARAMDAAGITESKLVSQFLYKYYN